MGRQQNVSEATAQKIDAEVRRLVEDGLDDARRILTEKQRRARGAGAGAARIRDAVRRRDPATSSTASRRCATPASTATPPRGSAGADRRPRPPAREPDGGMEPQPQA